MNILKISEEIKNQQQRHRRHTEKPNGNIRSENVVTKIKNLMTENSAEKWNRKSNQLT